jgi:hypothetical protein
MQLRAWGTGTNIVLFIWLIIRLIQLVFSVRTVFFSHKISANSVFQPAYNSSRTAPLWGVAPNRGIRGVRAFNLPTTERIAMARRRDLEEDGAGRETQARLGFARVGWWGEMCFAFAPVAPDFLF